METREDTKRIPPAYFAFKTLGNVADRMKPVGPPPQIDRSVLPGMSGAGQTQFIAGLKFLGFIDDAGKVQPRFGEYVKAGTSGRKRIMGEIVREKYPEAVALGSQNATTEQLIKVFVEEYGVKRGDTARKAIGFYLNAARYAEDVPVSVNFTTPRLRSGDPRGGAKAKKKATQTGGAGAGSDHEEPETPGAGKLHPGLAGVLADLPGRGRRWTQEERDRWVLAFTTMLDYSIPVGDDEDEEDGDDDFAADDGDQE
jgi:Family of unknown function (DUF5343)